MTPPGFVRASALRSGAGPRVVAATICAIATAVLVVAWWLTPDVSGMQTHRQLGLPPCGFMVTTGLPCATCGMTTAFSHAAHGQLWAAFRTQPAGAVLAMLTAAASLVSAWAAATGMSLAPLGRWLWRPTIVWSLGGLLIAAWIYKIILTHAAH